ncbi:MAG: hypothetical protein ABI776_19830 [Nocardioidaceae bacterium]
MGPSKSWAGILSRDRAAAQPDPHPATAMVHMDGFRFMSSVLPWRSCGPAWQGGTLADKLRVTLTVLRPFVDQETVWGGDWNQALEGPEHVGSLEGRQQVLELIGESKLSVPTSSLASAATGHRAVDHIAVPLTWDVDAACRVAASAGPRRLSDHDAYMVSVDD